MQIATSNSLLLGLDAPIAWSTQSAFEHLQSLGKADTKRTAERRLHELAILPPALTPESLIDGQGAPANPLLVDWALKRSRSKRQLVLFAQLGTLPDGQACLHANDSRGARYWRPLPDTREIHPALLELQALLAKEISLFPCGELVSKLQQSTLPDCIKIPGHLFPTRVGAEYAAPHGSMLSARLQRLEAESIHILREAAAESNKPALLFAGGKDSAVLLHLARKAFHPLPPPFPLVHIDTRWQFGETYPFRDQVARDSGMDLIVHSNPEAAARNINPFDHGRALHREIADAAALRQTIEHHGFDLLLCGKRRDDDPWQSKDAIFSRRDRHHRWHAAQHTVPLWDLYNLRKPPGESIRTFPLANWRELDVWQYIEQQGIAVPSLYFARERPVVIRNGRIYLIDDARFRLLPGEEIVERRVRFRALGCYPLTSAIESDATTLAAIVRELANNRHGERWPTDNERGNHLETLKTEGYY